jgi:hypothetical protein
MRAKAPEGDLGLVNDESVGLTRRQTWCRADCTVDVDGRAALSAHDVMVVVGNPCLEPGGTTSGLEAPKQPSRGQRMQVVINRLRREASQPFARRRRQRLGVGVRMLTYGIEHG